MRPTRPTTLDEALELAAGVPQTGLRFIDRRERERWVEWAEVFAESQRVAGALAGRGIGSGDTVGLLFSTTPEFFYAFFGALLTGAVPVPLAPPLRLGRLEEYRKRISVMVSTAGIGLALTEPGTKNRLQGSLGRTRCELMTLDQLGSNGHHRATVKPDDLAMIQFSSGTTVDPKPVALSHRAVMAQAVTLNGFWPDNATTRHSGASWLPLYHDMGLIGCVFPALERPSALTLIAPDVFVARPALWLRAISRHRASVSPAPNFAYGLCVERIRDDELEGVDLSCWQVALNGAETISPEVARSFCHRFSRWGFRAEAMTPVYGLAEASLAVTFSSVQQPFQTIRVARQPLRSTGTVVLDADGMELVSVGRPVPGFEIEVRNGTAARLPDAQVGSIWVKGPSLMSEYYGREEATRKVIHQGWLDTGDLGFTVDGNLYLTGRSKDILIVRGQNHAPEEIELIVASVPGVRAGGCAAVSLMPDDEPGETIILFIERESRVNGHSACALARAVARRVLSLTGIKPDRIEVLKPGTLPRTSSGKVRRAAAVHRYLAGELQGIDRQEGLATP